MLEKSLEPVSSVCINRYWLLFTFSPLLGGYQVIKCTSHPTHFVYQSSTEGTSMSFDGPGIYKVINGETTYSIGNGDGGTLNIRGIHGNCPISVGDTSADIDSKTQFMRIRYVSKLHAMSKCIVKWTSFPLHASYWSTKV